MPREESTPVVLGSASMMSVPVSSAVNTRTCSLGFIDTMLALTPVALLPLLALLMRSRSSFRVSVAKTSIVTLPMVKSPEMEPAAPPEAVPRSVVRLEKLAEPSLWARAVCTTSRVWLPLRALLATLTPTRFAGSDAPLPSSRLPVTKACLVSKMLPMSPKVTAPRRVSTVWLSRLISDESSP